VGENKYGKYVITETPANPRHPETREKGNPTPLENTLYISNGLDGLIPNIPYLETSMVLRTTQGETPDTKSHSHAFDEYLIFLGTNPQDLFDLGGEVEFWIGDEKQIITRSCAVFVPRGISHCPLYIHRVSRPFIFITSSNESKYQQEADKK
jgi:hypothetical protein